MTEGTADRTGLVLAGGGARGAYEAGVLSYLYESVYPKIPGFEFDVCSGTSVGAVHAAFTAASHHMEGVPRARRLVETWHGMEVGKVLELGVGDLIGLPLRALGLGRGRGGRSEERAVLGGLVDVTPLERIVEERIPWDHLDANLSAGRPRALCVSCTEVRGGRVTIFMNGALADPNPWLYDPNAQAIHAPVTARHVRASAAIPFLFPAVRIADRYYVDGGLRMNTPLSPALRLGASRILVVALRRSRYDPDAEVAAYPEEVVTQPAFMMGKVLDALTLDQLEYEIQRIDLVNAIIERGEAVWGEDFLKQINVAVHAQRGVAYRKVKAAVVRPSEDLGRLAAECWAKSGNARAMGLLPSLVTRIAKIGVPENEADLLSYLYFDGTYTSRLVELGREDARARRDDLMELLGA